MISGRVVNANVQMHEVYIGRAGRGQDGYFGSPCVVGERCPVCDGIHRAPGETLSCFERYARQRLETDADYRKRVKELHGKVLGCPHSGPCHGYVLLRLAAELQGEGT